MSEDYSNILCFFIGYAPPGNILTLQILRLFLVVSEHSDGEKPISDISLLFNSQMLHRE